MNNVKSPTRIALVSMLLLAVTSLQPSAVQANDGSGLVDFSDFVIWHRGNSQSGAGTAEAAELLLFNDCQFAADISVRIVVNGQGGNDIFLSLGPGQSILLPLTSGTDGPSDPHTIIRVSTQPGPCAATGAKQIRAAVATIDEEGKTRAVLEQTRFRPGAHAVQSASPQHPPASLLRIAPGQRFEGIVFNSCQAPVMAMIALTRLKTGEKIFLDSLVELGQFGVMSDTLVEPDDDPEWVRVETTASPLRSAPDLCPPGQGGIPGSTGLVNDDNSVVNPTMVEYAIMYL